MSIEYRKLLPQSPPSVDWFEDLPLPKGKSFLCIGREQICLDQIKRTNSEGQVTNIARELGTNKEHIQSLANNIKINGVLLGAQPPFVGKNLQLFDGYGRTTAFSLMGLDSWVFNVVIPKDDFTWNDVWDEIGLGANNHPPSKGASRGDFRKRLSNWVNGLENLPTQGECVDWINNIPHSFSQEVVSNVAQEVLKSRLASYTMESVDSKMIVNRAMSEIPAISRNDILPLRMSGRQPEVYIKRAAFVSLEALSDPNKNQPICVSYVKDTPAEEVEEVRQAALDSVEKINELFEKAFKARSDKGKDFKLLTVDYIMPQIIGVETNLIPVEDLVGDTE